MSSSCEKGIKLYGHNIEKSKKYCEEHHRIENSIVKPHYHPTVSGRYYGEKWINICDEKDCDLGEILNPIDSRSKLCYPTIRLDENTGVLASELKKEQKERLCQIEFFNEIPKEILLNIRLAKLLIREGAKRYYKSEIEDFTISETNITPEMLYLWKCWIDLHGPDYGHMCLHPETPNSKVTYPNTTIRPINYYIKYKKWINLELSNGSQSGWKESTAPEGAIEWLLKGGNEAYLWLKTRWVRDTILSKYPWVCFDSKNRL